MPRKHNARPSRLLPAPLSGNTAHQGQTRGVLPAAPFSLANLGGPSSLGLRAVPSWGRKETEKGC